MIDARLHYDFCVSARIVVLYFVSLLEVHFALQTFRELELFNMLFLFTQLLSTSATSIVTADDRSILLFGLR